MRSYSQFVKKVFQVWVTSGRYVHKGRISNKPFKLKAMYPFTFKEKEVLALISMGLTTKEIAGKLNISHHTVETHRKNLLRKCEAKNSAQLVQLALANQILAA
jgi:DNA-binding CsgD family transcriptional regulator